MPPFNKSNKKTNSKSKKKKKKNVTAKSFTNPPTVTEEQKEFYLDQIHALEPRLLK